MLALTLAACGSSTASVSTSFTPSPEPSPIPSPASLVTPGKLTIGSDLSYAPQEYIGRDGKAKGFDIDLARAIAAEMRLQLAVVNIDTPSIVPGFAQQQRRYDFGISAQPETADLAQGARTLEYFVAGLAILVPAANPHNITGPNSLCGLRVGAERDSSAERAISQQNERPCASKQVDYHGYTLDNDAVSDLRAGSLDAVIDDYPVSVLFAHDLSGLKVVPHQFATSKDVMVFPLSGNDDVYNAVGEAFDRLRRNGTYRKLLHLWNLDEGALT